jgi:hypothetical protein
MMAGMESSSGRMGLVFGTFVLVCAGIWTGACKDKRASSSHQPAAASNKLTILKAIWGPLHEPGGKDITQTLAGMVNGDALEVKATVATLGDPADLKIKQLRVEYRKGEVVSAKHVMEGETLVIAADEKAVPIRLVVTKAVYGNLEKGKVLDVTGPVADMVKANTLQVTPTNLLFGRDPAKVQIKHLRVDYTFDGAPKTRTVLENEALTISPSNP